MTKPVTDGQGRTLAAIQTEADLAAGSAASASDVTVRELAEVSELSAVSELFQSIWGSDRGSRPVPTELLRAMATAGNYVAGAFDGDQLLGACFGFFGEPSRGSLHSHIAGVAPGGLGRGLGFALKLHQRAWALRRQVGTISWTFDPLVCRNAHFNITKLGARPVQYWPDFYGPMHDGINGTSETDRLLVAWDLAGPPARAGARGEPAHTDASALRAQGAGIALAAGEDGRPVTGPGDGPVTLVAVPPDIEALRRRDPAMGQSWRSALRDVLHGLMTDGAAVTGFDRAGWYVTERKRWS
ncbi:GNAT family N-acetyltransferase [Streptomyces naganishii]|uniref:GNAT family N-acetyltransferase n=1 Tax=Streptomyces naganishii TaxID=285447 RepID=UPI0036AE7A8B